MVYRKFYIQIIIRIILIVISCLVFAFVINNLNKEYYFTFIGIGLVIILQTFLLFVYVNRINFDLSVFFESISNQEGMLLFPENKSGIFSDLHKSLNVLIQTVEAAKIQNDKQRLFLHTLINSINVGIIFFDSDGKILLQNNAFKNLFGIDPISNIKDLDKIKSGLSKTFVNLKPGKTGVIKLAVNRGKAVLGGEVMQLSCRTSLLKQDNRQTKLVTVQNIISELETNELESWKKLIKVLIHEITNSITPITSLSNSLAKYYENDKGETTGSDHINEKIIARTKEGLDAISETGSGLINFVREFRNLSMIPPPKPKRFLVKDLLTNIGAMYAEKLSKHKIHFNLDVNENEMEMEADFSQIEQVLINLMNNAIDALEDVTGSEIEIKAFKGDDGYGNIQVIDNGSGITEEEMVNIFVPFYTTKKNGSGIGLSLSRELLRNNGMRLLASSTSQTGTVFSIRYEL